MRDWLRRLGNYRRMDTQMAASTSISLCSSATCLSFPNVEQSPSIAERAFSNFSHSFFHHFLPKTIFGVLSLLQTIDRGVAVSRDLDLKTRRSLAPIVSLTFQTTTHPLPSSLNRRSLAFPTAIFLTTTLLDYRDIRKPQNPKTKLTLRRAIFETAPMYMR